MNTDKEKEMPRGTDKQEERKSFIVEKVVGREISRKNAAKHLLLALGSGILFGLAAAAAIVLTGKAAAHFGSTEDIAQEQETVIESVEEPELPQSAPEEVTQSVATTAPEETADKLPVYIDGVEYFIEKAELRRLIDEELKNDDIRRYDLKTAAEDSKAVIENTDRFVVSVNALSTNQSWFEDMVETQSTFSGIIISKTATELLILTTEEAARSGNAFNVTFYDGTTKAAVLKQSSHHDRISVIAVSKEGLGKEFLKNIQPITLGSSSAIEAGDTVLAIGAPIGKVRSYEFGQVSYVGHNEITADGKKDVFYSQISADTVKGTFITNLKGEFIGIAKAADEDARYYGESSAVRIISVDYLNDIISHLKAGTEVPYIGIKGKSISFDMKYKNIPQGMYVVECVEDSPAYVAGIKKGDIITGLDDISISNSDDYEHAVKKLKSGAVVKLKLKRSSANAEYRDLEFVITVGAR